MAWTIRLSAEAREQLSELPRDQQAMIGRALDRMRENPFLGNIRALKDKKYKGQYRKVVGRYRLFFIPLHQEHLVHIISVRLRTEKTYG
jgi:mRNA-degrading endonuclease RelE of RelBE toxin-antitoxin system